VLFVAFVVLSLSAIRLTAADWAPQLSAGAAWDDNATNANRASDRIGGLRLDAALPSSSAPA